MKTNSKVIWNSQHRNLKITLPANWATKGNAVKWVSKRNASTQHWRNQSQNLTKHLKQRSDISIISDHFIGHLHILKKHKHPASKKSESTYDEAPEVKVRYFNCIWSFYGTLTHPVASEGTVMALHLHKNYYVCPDMKGDIWYVTVTELQVNFVRSNCKFCPWRK